MGRRQRGNHKGCPYKAAPAGGWWVDGRRWGLAAGAADAFEAGGTVRAFDAGLELVVGAGVLVSTVVPPASWQLDVAGYGVTEVLAIGAGGGFNAGLQVSVPVVVPSLAGAAAGGGPSSERAPRVALGGFLVTVGRAGGQVGRQSVLENGGQGTPFPGPAAAAFLLGELKDALRGYAGDAVFAVGQPAFLPRRKAAETALALGAVVLGAVAVVMGVGVVIDLALGPGVGLVEGAVEGFAAVGG